MSETRRIYADHAATTPVAPETLAAMLPFFIETYGNPQSSHFFGREAERAARAARQKIADAVNCNPKEIYFTSGGTEADNWAVAGVVRAQKDKGRHIVISAVEHSAVRDTCLLLEKEGVTFTEVPVGADGIVDPDEVKKAVRPDTVLISVTAAASETGNIQPVEKIAGIAAERGICFHSDAVAAAGNIPVDVKRWGPDLVSFSAHKAYGPKGIGALYIKEGVRIEKLIAGGHQEREYRGGTLNVPAAVGMGAAFAAFKGNGEQNARVREIRDRFLDAALSISGTSLNGSRENRLPGNANLSFSGVDGDALLMLLDMEGVSASRGSACAAGSREPSRAVTAVSGAAAAVSAVRFTFGAGNTLRDADDAAARLKTCLEKLRSF